MTASDDPTLHVIAMQRLTGANVRRFRTALALTVDEIAARIGSDADTVTAIEDGRIDIDIDTLVALADALGTGVHILVAPGRIEP